MNANNDLEVIYENTVMKCIRKHEVYILKDKLHKLTTKEQLNLIGEVSWKGQVYEVQVGELVTFDRSNNWDLSYFTLEGGAEFKKYCGNPLSYLNAENFELVHLEGNPYDERYLKFIEKYPKFKI